MPVLVFLPRRTLALAGSLILLATCLAEKPSHPLQRRFESQIRPFLQQYCIRCHNVDDRESGVRVDHFDGLMKESTLKLWERIREQVGEQVMPPEDEELPGAEARQAFAKWIDDALHEARSRTDDVSGSVRRLTVAQYRNTLAELLDLEDDFTTTLPADGISKDGFTNDSKTLSLSPLQVEAWFRIAEQALDASLVDETTRPAIQKFRMELGDSINPEPLPEKLILGALSRLLENKDFIVTEPLPEKTFAFDRRPMKTGYRFNEGYSGNATVRGWRDYTSIYHSVFACVRGTDGYPKGEPFELVPNGLLLRPAIPNDSVWQRTSTYGPHANFKIALRELPASGQFRITVNAAKYNDGLLLGDRQVDPAEPSDSSEQLRIPIEQLSGKLEIPTPGIYQIDVFAKSIEDTDKKQNKRKVTLRIDGRQFTSRLKHPALVALRLPAGTIPCSIEPSNVADHLERIVFTRLPNDAPLAKRFQTFERQDAFVGVHVGLRRDCGHTYKQVGVPQVVSGLDFHQYVFTGAINNYPRPDVQKDNDNYLAGVREIVVHSEYTDGRDRPRLLVRSVDFEGPFYETWPPESHQKILFASENRDDLPTYARDVIARFATRAFRRPVETSELEPLMKVFEESFRDTNDFQQSVKNALVVVLTSPSFLFLVEESQSSDPEPLGQWELASKLSYFLWNGPPDQELLDCAADGSLSDQLPQQVERMIHAPSFSRFSDQFASEWLGLDRFDNVEIDHGKYPKLTEFVKTELRQEPARTLEYLIRNNLSVRELIHSNTILANEVVANYYELQRPCESGFDFVPLHVENQPLGGVLSQAAILAGLSDGREANPVKRGAWFARKIIAEPPDDPPPNVPELKDDRDLSLRERLEQHRNVKGCAKCHEGIDPWGLVFEQFGAGGRFASTKISATSTLPDGVRVENLPEFQQYLMEQRLADVAFSMQKHLATYAIGRPLKYNEIRFLKRDGLNLGSNGFRLKDMIHAVVRSDLFLMK